MDHIERPSQKLQTVLVLVILATGAYLRFAELGTRSLWLDEFCTWRVSRMPIGESLRWGPELTKPPLYQFSLRMLTDAPRPGEAILRFPAALCGVLTILVAWRLGTQAGGDAVGVALAGLVALNGFHIAYSQEARSYTMLALGSGISTLCWFRVIAKPRVAWMAAFVVVSALSFHAHYLAVLTAAAHACWWFVVVLTRKRWFGFGLPAVAIGLTAVLCLPMALHYLRYRHSVFQGLDWIEPPSWHTVSATLARITYGPVWVYGVLAPSLVYIVWRALTGRKRDCRSRDGSCNAQGSSVDTAEDTGQDPPAPGMVGLLACVLLFNWLGLLLISLIAQPVMIDRYAIAASLPAMLIPLVAAQWIDRRLPWLFLAILAMATLPMNLTRADRIVPGFRELALFVDEHIEPSTETVLLAVDGRLPPGWEDMERTAFAYYPPTRTKFHELRVIPDQAASNPAEALDPRALWVVIFRADPEPSLRRAGRAPQPIQIGDRRFDQLLFEPYRLQYFMASEPRR